MNPKLKLVSGQHRIDPTEGTIYKHTLVTVHGGNFYESDKAMCNFGGRYTVAEYPQPNPGGPDTGGGTQSTSRENFACTGVGWARPVVLAGSPTISREK